MKDRMASTAALTARRWRSRSPDLLLGLQVQPLDNDQRRPSHFTDPYAAARKVVEIANASEAVQDGRIYIERINSPFLEEGGTPDQYRAALARSITLGWL
jgi:hypothetical protein